MIFSHMTSESITSKVVRVMCMETVNILSSIHFPVPDRISVPSDYQAKFRVPFWFWGARPPWSSRDAFFCFSDFKGNLLPDSRCCFYLYSDATTPLPAPNRRRTGTPVQLSTQPARTSHPARPSSARRLAGPVPRTAAR